MKQTSITVNLKGMERFKQGLGNSYVARVGVLADKAARSNAIGETNAEIGLIMMVGSVTKKIPPRDWLRFPIEYCRKELMNVMGKSKLVKSSVEKGDYKKVFQQLGVAAEVIIQRGFETGGFGQWAPLKQRTIDEKGSDAILIDTGQLRRSVSSDVAPKGDAK